MHKWWNILVSFIQRCGIHRGGSVGFGLHPFQVRFRLSRLPFRFRHDNIWNLSEQSDSDLFGLSRILLFAVLIPSSGIIPTSDFGLVGFGLSRIRTWSDSDLVRFGLDWIRTSSDPDIEFTFTIDTLNLKASSRIPTQLASEKSRNPTGTESDFWFLWSCLKIDSDFGLPTSALQSESESDSSPIPTSRNRIPTCRN